MVVLWICVEGGRGGGGGTRVSNLSTLPPSPFFYRSPPHFMNGENTRQTVGKRRDDAQIMFEVLRGKILWREASWLVRRTPWFTVSMKGSKDERVDHHPSRGRMAEGMDLERTNQRVTTSSLSPSREGETPPRESSSPLTTPKCSSTQEHTESLLTSVREREEEIKQWWNWRWIWEEVDMSSGETDQTVANVWPINNTLEED